MNSKDKVLFDYAAKLTKDTYNIYAQRFPDVMAKFSNSKIRVRFIENVYFMLLHQVSDVVFFIRLPAKRKRYHVPIGDKAKRVLKGALFGEGRVYRVIHSPSRNLSWGDMTPSERAKFKALYRELQMSVFHFLIFSTGGYADQKVADALDSLV